MDKSFVSNIKTHLSESKKIVVIPHLSPDADALGSCLAIYHFFRKNHKVSIISPNEYSEVLKFLPGEDVINRFDLSEENSIELESVPKLLSKPLKEKLKYNAQELNFLKRTSRAKLPL